MHYTYDELINIIEPTQPISVGDVITINDCEYKITSRYIEGSIGEPVTIKYEIQKIDDSYNTKNNMITVNDNYYSSEISISHDVMLKLIDTINEENNTREEFLKLLE